MKSFNQFIIENDSEYSKPDHPEHNLWKHGIPAVRNNDSGTITRGKRGETHEKIYHRLPEKNIYNKEKRAYPHTEGIYHTKNKTFHERGNDTEMDSTDLMTNVQRSRLENS